MGKDSIFEYRDLIFELTKHDLKSKYRESILGFIWYILEPLILMLILVFVFRMVFGATIENFEIWLLIGIEVHRFFQIGTFSCLGSVLGNQHLIKKIYFPREVLPISSTLVALINYVIEFIILIFLMLILNVSLKMTMLFIPLFVLLETGMILGMGFFLAALSTKFRDLFVIWGLIIQLLFWFCPIVYDISLVATNYPNFLNIYLLNPLSQLILSMRNVIIDGTIPSLFSFLYMTIVSIVFLILGYYFFKWRSKKFAEEI